MITKTAIALNWLNDRYNPWRKIRELQRQCALNELVLAEQDRKIRKLLRANQDLRGQIQRITMRAIRRSKDHKDVCSARSR